MFVNAGARLLCTLDGVCVIVYVCRGRYGFGGVVLLSILGSNLGGVGPVRSLWGGRKEEGEMKRRKMPGPPMALV